MITGKRPFSALANGHPIRNPDGTVTGAVAVYHDITAMRSAEKKSEERFRRIVESAPNAMVMINAQILGRSGKHFLLHLAETPTGPRKSFVICAEHERPRRGDSGALKAITR